MGLSVVGKSCPWKLMVREFLAPEFYSEIVNNCICLSTYTKVEKRIMAFISFHGKDMHVPLSVIVWCTRVCLYVYVQTVVFCLFTCFFF